MFRFATPYCFFLLIPLCIAAWYVYRRSVRKGTLFSATVRIPRQGNSWRAAVALVCPALAVLGLVLVVLALARPQTVFSRIRRKTDAIAIEMVVDVSGSMEALDLSPKTATGYKFRTRLDAVKEVFAEFIAGRPDDLIGLISFGGFATTRAPLTADHNALLHVLKGVEIPKPSRDKNGRVTNMEELNTAIGDALATACARLEAAEPESRIIVLLSDGESNTGIIEPEKAIEAAEKLGLKIYSIGVGSTGRAPFKGRDMMGRETVEWVNVVLDEKLLRKVADRTGGKYFNVKDPEGLKNALEDIDSLERTEIERDIYSHYNELFPWFLVAALGLIIAGSGINMMVARRVV